MKKYIINTGNKIVQKSAFFLCSIFSQISVFRPTATSSPSENLKVSCEKTLRKLFKEVWLAPHTVTSRELSRGQRTVWIDPHCLDPAFIIQTRDLEVQRAYTHLSAGGLAPKVEFIWRAV